MRPAPSRRATGWPGRHVRRAGRAGRDGLPRRPPPARPRRRARGAGLRPARPARPARCSTSAGWASATRTPQPLVVDWRAPAAAAFYRATAGRAAGRGAPPHDPVAPASGSPASRTTCSTPRPPRRSMRVVGDGALLATPVQGHRAGHAGHRRDHPAGAGRGDPLPRLRRDDRRPAARAPARPRWPCTGRRTCSTPTAAGSPAAASWWSARPACSSSTSRRCCPRSARTPRPCTRWARWCPGYDRHPDRPARGGGDQGLAADAPGAGAGRRATRCRAARASCGCSTGARCCGWTGGELDADPATGRCTGGRAATRSAGPASTGSSPRSGRRPAGCTIAGCRSSAAFEDEIAERPEFREFLKAWWPRLHPRHVLGWLARPGAAAPVRRAGCSPGAEIATAAARRTGRWTTDGLTIADVALLDELDALLGTPARRPRSRPRPVPAAGGVRELSTFADRQRGRPGQAARSDRRTTGTTRTWWWTRRRTSRRCSGGWSAGAAGRVLDGGGRPGADRVDRRPGGAGPGPGPGAGPAPAATATR